MQFENLDKRNERNETFIHSKFPHDRGNSAIRRLLEIGTSDPYAIVTADQGEDENYNPEDEGYQDLLEQYKETYPEDE